MSKVAHFFLVVGGSIIHERLAHFFVDVYNADKKRECMEDGENAEALSIRHLAAEQKCAVADLLQGLTLCNNSNDKDGFARARLLLQVIKAMGL